jgi:hypothetical protein
MCCAAWAWLASTSSSRGGVNNDARMTAAKIADKSAHAARVEGVFDGLPKEFVWLVIEKSAAV